MKRNSKILGRLATLTTATAAAMVLAALPVQAQVTNGGFETSTPACTSPFDTLSTGSTQIAPWSVDSGSVDLICTLWEDAEGAGSQSLDMSGSAAGSVSQAIATVSGEFYVVRFSLSGNPACGSVVKTLRVSAGGATQVYSFDSSGNTIPTPMNWQPEQLSFQATGSSTTVSFTSLENSACGPALDAVSVEQVTGLGLDHYACYRINDETPSQTVSTDDQLVSNPALVLNSAREICAPVSKNGEPIINAEAHLICYDTEEPDEATLTLPVGEKPLLLVEDQFGPREVQARVTKTKRVCVPASKEVLVPDLDNDDPS